MVVVNHANGSNVIGLVMCGGGGVFLYFSNVYILFVFYQVKYLEQAARLSFGRGMGCRVATQKCNDWGAEAAEQGMFCAQRAENFCMGRSKQVFGYCNIKDYPEALPSQFQYFPFTPTLGGKRDYPDYCPRRTEVMFGDCTDLNNMGKPRMDDAASGSQVGAESRCFLSSLVAASARTDGSVGTRTDNSVAVRARGRGEAMRIKVFRVRGGVRVSRVKVSVFDVVLRTKCNA